MSNIPSSEISVVVQGPVVGKPSDPKEKRLTLRCLESIRHRLPDAEIVLSTWRGADVTGLPYDILQENEDPGGTSCRIGEKYLNNVNRQIVSTRSGLERATRKYAMKLRSDMVLTGDGFREHFGKYRERAGRYCILEERVLASTVYSSNPRRGIPYCFHPSDWFFFGLRNDLWNIWDIPLSPEPESSQWLAGRPRPVPDYDPLNLARYAPEQYIWLSFLRKSEPIPFDFSWERSEEQIESSEISLVNNLVLLDPKHLGIAFMKYSFMRNHWLRLYTHGEWLRLYKRYCAPNLLVLPDLVALYKSFGHWYIGWTTKILRRYGFHGEYSVRWMMHVLFRPEGRIRRTLRGIMRALSFTARKS